MATYSYMLRDKGCYLPTEFFPQESLLVFEFEKKSRKLGADSDPRFSNLYSSFSQEAIGVPNFYKGTELLKEYMSGGTSSQKVLSWNPSVKKTK